MLAALTLNPLLPADLDIVACYTSLGNLLRFVLGKDKSFRVLVQAVDNTVFFARRENSPTEKLEGIKGHGHTFPEAYTTWDRDVKGSDTSHRILKYTFGGLRMLVRAEADAYLADEGTTTLPASASPLTQPDASSSSSSSSLNQMISTLGPTPATSPPTSASKITTLTGPADQPPQSKILEIKTRGIWKKGKEDTVAEEMPKLWLARIQNLVVAYHDRGRFGGVDGIAVRDVRQRVDSWEKGCAARELAWFAALLHEVVGMVTARADGRVELCRTGMGSLEVREWGGDVGGLLSEEMKGRWREGGKRDGVGAGEG